MKAMVASIALVALSGCSFTPIITNNHTYTRLHPYPKVKTITVHISDDFDKEDQKSISDAIDEWAYVFNGFVDFKSVSGNADLEIVKTLYSQLPVNSNDLAFMDNIGGRKLTIVRDRFLSQRALSEATLHELGHAFGMIHNDIPGGRFGKGLSSGRFSLTEYQCVDEYTVRQVALYQRLDPSKMNYCTVLPTVSE